MDIPLVSPSLERERSILYKGVLARMLSPKRGGL